MSHLYPSHLKFTEDHEWAELKTMLQLLGLPTLLSQHLGTSSMLELPKKAQKYPRATHLELWNRLSP